jgi:hypothetical protein
MNNSLAQRAIGIGVFLLFILALNVGSYLLGCGTFWY